MELNELKIVNVFKERLKNRLIVAWWMICIFFVLSFVVYYLLNKSNVYKNLQIFMIIAIIILLICIILTTIYYYTRKNKFFMILSNLDNDDIIRQENLYASALSYSKIKPVIFTREGVNILKGCSMFDFIPASDIVWICETTLVRQKKDKRTYRIPCLSIVDVANRVYEFIGYKLDNLIRQMYFNVYFSKEGTLLHKEYLNKYSYNFNQFIRKIGKTPKIVNESKKSKTTVQEKVKRVEKTSYENIRQNNKSDVINKKEKQSFINILSNFIFFIGGILLVLFIIFLIVNFYPVYGKKVLYLNSIFSIIFTGFIVGIIFKYILNFKKLTKISNIFLIMVLIVLLLQFKFSKIYNSIVDLGSESTARVFNITKFIPYRSFFIQNTSKYLIYGASKNSDTTEKFVISSNGIDKNSDLANFINKYSNEYPLISEQLLIYFYPKTKVIEKIEVLTK